MQLRTCSERGPTVTWVSLCYENNDMDKTDIILFLSFITKKRLVLQAMMRMYSLNIYYL